MMSEFRSFAKATLCLSHLIQQAGKLGLKEHHAFLVKQEPNQYSCDSTPIFKDLPHFITVPNVFLEAHVCTRRWRP